MVRTMEANKYFVGKDRVYVGSLLMVVLQEKMGYCTEMLKQLLRELIEKTVEKKFQPKILFRRSESIAERMLAAWFTFLLHDHLKVGKKIFFFWKNRKLFSKKLIGDDDQYYLIDKKILIEKFLKPRKKFFFSRVFWMLKIDFCNFQWIFDFSLIFE